jgi:RHS repeat-associated protein
MSVSLRTVRRFLFALGVTVLSGSLVTAARADVHPNTAPGFPGDESFHVGDIDSVNLFNGSLTLTIPIGTSYPVNGGFSYNLKLVYNSNPWSFVTVYYPPVAPTDPDVPRTQAQPSPCSNAGLGWRVSLGRIDPPCQVPGRDIPLTTRLYQDETGTDHIFYPTVHYGDADDTLPPNVSDVQYTRDGTYLRMLINTDGTRDIDFPDGSVRHFGADGLPTMITDAFGNSLSINYDTANEWILKDSQNRTQTIRFRTDLASYPQGVIDSIELTVFGNTTFRYLFNYTVQTIGRACPHNDTGIMMSSGPTVLVPLLRSVILPDGSSWSASGVSDYVTAVPPSGASCTDNAGDLTGLTLPTLGRMEWTWQTVTFPTGSTPKVHLQRNSAVATRTMRNGDGSIAGAWTYTFGPPFPDSETSQERTTTVIDPLGHSTVNYFSASLEPSYTGWSAYEYSLPFTHNQTEDASGTTLNLSRQVYNSGGTLLRSEYVLYEHDPVFGVAAPDSINTNRRVLRSRTVYNDDAGNYGGTINSSFDGLGHYRTQQTEGNFPGSNVRTHVGNYNPGQGTYTVNIAANTGAGFTLFPSSSKWVLEAPTYTSDSEGGSTAETELCYSPGTTAVTRKRVHRLDGGSQSTQDLVSTYDLSGQGNVTAEKSYGGDVQKGIGAGDLCSAALPASPEYEIDHTYASGVRATSEYAGTNFFVFNETIDANTGLASQSADSATLVTNYEYDALGRLTWSMPQGTGEGGWTQYSYTAASGGTPPNVIVQRRANGSKTAPVLAQNQLVFDSFGRIYQEFRKLPDNSSAKRQTTYDGNGNKSSVSEWTTGTPGNLTTFLNYDPFGRPSTIQPPDGAAHDVTMTYHGVRQVDRTVAVATAQSAEASSTTTEIYDNQGRLVSVTEPSGSGGANVTTSYGYDVGNRLSSVSTTAAGVTQTRSFTYDRAGLLTSETHPEKGAAGNGSVTYPSYDSRGHALRKIDGPHDLTFTYEAAERLRQVKETGGAGRLLKDFTYASANGTNDWRQGKLQQANRYNYLTIGTTPFTVQVGETYTYGGRDGRVSQRDSLITSNGGTSASFTQGFTYNDLGLVSALSYPLCNQAGCTSPAVFADVPAGAPDQREIEALYAAHITGGCTTGSPLDYCPNANITRAQMAVFLLVAKEGAGYAPPACTTPIFADLPCSSPYAPWVQEMYRRGITGGCGTNPLTYCPDNSITNAQMAVFVLGTLGVTPPACSSAPFTDVPCTSFAASFIAEEARRQITSGCGGGNFCPNGLVTRAQMAGLLVRAFDIPVATDASTQRSVQFAYTQGLLTSVGSGTTTYGTLSYYPNLLVSQIAHLNGVTETQTNDPHEMRRPAAVAASGTYAGWSSGPYGYDGAGNIKAMGTSWFTYDAVSRLVSANLFDGPTGAGNPKNQSYSFDAFGNLQSIAGTSGRSTPTSSQTNRLSGAAGYDAAGNLTSWNGASYTYDAFNQMLQMASGAESWAYLYTADDERIWSYDIVRNASHWTVRDLGGKVLRDYVSNQGNWSVGTDYLYRDGLLLAAETQNGQRHFHLDHLGTPRLITRAGGESVAYHLYYPFGEEATAFNQDTERMKFTGHERDLASPSGPGDDLDYMHARHESPVTGRFLSVDAKEAKLEVPQSWDRYGYALGNPLRYLDPDGLSPMDFWKWGEYVVRYFADDHGGVKHYHVFDKGGRRFLGRVDMKGNPMKGNPEDIPGSLMKKLAKAGFFAATVTGIMMFFDASPAGAETLPDEIQGDPAELKALAKSFFGTDDLSKLSPDQLLIVQFEYKEGKAQELKAKNENNKKNDKDQENAEESLDSLQSFSCSFFGACSQ